MKSKSQAERSPKPHGVAFKATRLLTRLLPIASWLFTVCALTAPTVTRAAVNAIGVQVETASGGRTTYSLLLTPGTALVGNGSNLPTVTDVATQAELNAAALGFQATDPALTALAAGSDFVQFTGPAASTKVFTLPNASSTLLYSGGAILGPVTDKAGQVFNVQGYGILPANSGAANTAAWPAFLAVLPAAGATVYFPHGIYQFSTALNLTNLSYIHLIGEGSSTRGVGATTLNWSGTTGHGLDMTGASSFLVENFCITATGASSKAGIFLARIDGGAAGGNHRFNGVNISGDWAFCVYNYGTEEDSWYKCGFTPTSGNPVLICADNEMSYISTFATVETGGQSTSTHSFFDCGIWRVGDAVSNGYRGALNLDDVIDVRIFGGIINAADPATGAFCLHIKTGCTALSLHGVRFEQAAAACIYVDDCSVNGLSVIGGTAGGAKVDAGTSALIKKNTTGSVSGLTVDNFGVGAFTNAANIMASLVILDNAHINNVGLTTITATSRFGGYLGGVENLAQLTLPSDQVGMVHSRSGIMTVLGRLDGTNATMDKLHVGGTSDAGANNLLVDGDVTISGNDLIGGAGAFQLSAAGTNTVNIGNTGTNTGQLTIANNTVNVLTLAGNNHIVGVNSLGVFQNVTEATVGGLGAATVAGGLFVTKAIVSDSDTSASSSTTGGIIQNGSSAATSVGIGGGNINAGGSIAVGGNAVITGNITAPLVLGGTATTADLSLQTTSGVGATGADMHFLVGNNGATEAATILNSGFVGIGTTAPLSPLQVHTAANAGAEQIGLSLASSDFGTTLGDINTIAWRSSGGATVVGKIQAVTVASGVDFAFLTRIGGGTLPEIMRIKNTGVVTINPTTASTTKDTGSLVLTDGGLGVEGAINAGGLGSFGGSITSTSATGGVGYAAGAGGTVTQITDRTTGVTLNTVTGTITTDTTAIAGQVSASFTVTNSACAINDVPTVAIRSGQTNKKTDVRVTAVAAGSFEVTIDNGSLTVAEVGAIVINFAIVKGAVN